MAKVYVSISADFIHHGHLNIINIARQYGDIIIGLQTDESVASWDRLPLLTWEQRKIIMENIKGVKEVIPQDTPDGVENLKKIKPEYVVHGDDWKTGILSSARQKVIDVLKEWNGKLIEPPYTKGISSSQISGIIREVGTTPEVRMKSFIRLLKAKPLIRIMEAHNGVTGLIVENARVVKENKVNEFDGMWISSLTDSVSKGQPDIEYVDFTSRLSTINQILDITTKPIILDGDSGGQIEHFVLFVKTLERLGISAVIIEDKVGLKRNSLFGTEVEQTQDTIERFSAKITAGKKALVTDCFLIIARIESLILKAGQEDALKRAKAYIEAGADGIMIHSKEKAPKEILDFCAEYKRFEKKVPLVVVPSTYNSIYESELQEAGVNIVIYANHLLRSAIPAMMNASRIILENERSYETNDICMPIKEILTLIPGA